MESTGVDELAFDFSPFVRQYKNGQVDRLMPIQTVPPSHDLLTSVLSKDVVIDPQTGVSARLYLPHIQRPSSGEKLPLLVYFHGGAFCVESAFSPSYHTHLNTVASEAKVVVVSVEYRLAPEYPLPVCYDDSWAALQWVNSHSSGSGSGSGPESWLNDHADFNRMFFGGDSAGANIAHNMVRRVTDKTQLPGLNLVGLMLIHPYFCWDHRVGFDSNPRGLKIWKFLCPNSSGLDDPLVNPGADSNLSDLGCTRVLVCVGGKDMMNKLGRVYYETLNKSGWGGNLEIFESEGEDHVFHLFNPKCEKALELMNKFVLFINQ